MRIIGIDPGTVITGIGIIDCEEDSLSGLFYDTINLNSKESIPFRLKKIYEECLSVIEKFKPDEFAIETAFYGKNIQSTLKLGQARGVALIAALNSDLKIFEYSPREIKKSVTGSGASSKQQVKFMVQSMLNLKNSSAVFDTTDALAVALCHHFCSGANGKFHSTKTGKRNSFSWKAYLENNPQKIFN